MVLYAMLSGQAPWNQEQEMQQIMQQIMTEDIAFIAPIWGLLSARARGEKAMNIAS